MTKEEIKIGKKVWYHPIWDLPEKEEAIIITEPFEMCGTTCCFINIRSSCVDIENLEDIESTFKIEEKQNEND